ncbi:MULTISPECIES: hypothetical protein [unclassified Microbacterium]|uniref:hypothetical protein n=1 Tax=unclassified Microbacterium TaxID=2609290 RepID=UPI000EA92990|nr:MULTISPECIES: hypothetical protein [unclassified Microbacterium]MBT2484470.1 hypothetical protein [Microbacterium sp. ISL-108]RKN67376.1 hypothetical protein D7252_07145 [Microbacterium sp. CGR2]
MSQSYGEGAPGVEHAGSQSSGTIETAKQDAAELKDSVTQHAGDVVGTAKSEAGAVAHEAKNQAKDLYAQTTSELKEQAAVQQRRVAEGLRAVGGELGTMADNSEEGGVGADLVRQVSQKVEGVAGWIGDRDPGALLSEVKSYARAKPGTFIAVAALAGLVAGRLTRALSEGAKEAHDASSTEASGTGVGATSVPAVTTPAPPAPPVVPPTANEWTAPPPPAPPVVPAAPDGISGQQAGTATSPADGDTPVFDQTGGANRTPFGDERP